MDTDWEQREQEMAPVWGHLEGRTYLVSARSIRRAALIIGLIALLVVAVVVGLVMPV